MNLPPAEKEVLTMAANGLLNKQIADRRGVSIFTVRAQMRLIAVRLGAKGRAHAVAIAVRGGLI